MTTTNEPGTAPLQGAVRTTYAPPVRTSDRPRDRHDWRRLTGLTDPLVLEALVRLRSSGAPSDPTYDDFFRRA